MSPGRTRDSCRQINRKYGITLELFQWTGFQAEPGPESIALMRKLILGSFVGLDIAQHLLQRRISSSGRSGKRHGGEHAGAKPVLVFVLLVWTHTFAYWVVGVLRSYGG